MKNSKPLLAIVDRDCKTFDDTSDSIYSWSDITKQISQFLNIIKLSILKLKKTNKHIQYWPRETANERHFKMAVEIAAVVF